MANHEPKDIYSRVTDKIVADLEKGLAPWRKPWSGGNTDGRIMRPLRATGIPYQGINVLMLWSAAAERGYVNPIWMTFRQAAAIGGNVRKGEKSTLVVFADRFTKTEANAAGEKIERSIPFLKGYHVFNVEQIENLPAQYSNPPAPPAPQNREERIGRLDTFFRQTGAEIKHGGNSAHYSRALDLIAMPEFTAFENAESYYATLAHETIHWTGFPSRLNREFTRSARFGNDEYAREELVAELGCAFLCADLGITPETREDHAAYIKSWLEALKNDKRCIFWAASHAARATEYLHDFNRPNPAPKTELDDPDPA